MAPSDVHDEQAWREYRLSELCQACRERLFLAYPADGEQRRYALRTGALVGVRRVAGASYGAAQLACIPFTFGAPGRPVAWEPTSIVYAGPVPPASELDVCLRPMRSFLGCYQVRICAPRDLSPSLPAPRYGPFAVVVTRDVGTFRDAALICEEFAQAGHVALEPVLRERGFDSLESFVSRTGVDADYCAVDLDPLRTCSWLGAALELGRPDPGLFEHVLAPYRIPASGAVDPIVDR